MPQVCPEENVIQDAPKYTASGKKIPAVMSPDPILCVEGHSSSPSTTPRPPVLHLWLLHCLLKKSRYICSVPLTTFQQELDCIAYTLRIKNKRTATINRT